MRHRRTLMPDQVVTHIFLWLQAEPERLDSLSETLEDPANDLILSAASSWEIAIKYGLGRLPLPEPPPSYVPTRLAAIGATPLAIEHPHVLAVAHLPPIHRDPFDRLLVAQSQLLDLTLVTVDQVFDGYEVATLRP